MVSYQEFITCKNCLFKYLSLNTKFENKYEDEHDKELRLKICIQQIFYTNELSEIIQNEICQKFFGYTKDIVEYKIQSHTGMQTKNILAPNRFPYIFSLNNNERKLYFSIIDAYCQHTNNCDCSLIMPHHYEGEKWNTIYDNIQELFENTNKLLFLKMDKLEKNLGLRQGLISKSIIRGTKIQCKTFFYQNICLNKYAFHALVTKNGKICYLSK